MADSKVPAGYENNVHLCVKKRTGHTWYCVSSSTTHYTNADIFADELAELTAHFPEFEFAIKPYERRKLAPFRLNLVELDRENVAFEIEHDGWV